MMMKLKELFVYFTFGHHLDFVTTELIHWRFKNIFISHLTCVKNAR